LPGVSCFRPELSGKRSDEKEGLNGLGGLSDSAQTRDLAGTHQCTFLENVDLVEEMAKVKEQLPDVGVKVLQFLRRQSYLYYFWHN
jgi:hypothetical protein